MQTPIAYNSATFMGVLHHEIGSHLIRRFNEIQLPWNKCREAYSLESSILQEEGSGCLNFYLEQSKDAFDADLKEEDRRRTYLFKPALNYYMCCKASEMSFYELYKDLEKYVDSPKLRYKFVLRIKRSLSDTSQPGGLYKDQVYLEGAVILLQSRNEINWQAYYSAKINIEDLKRQRIMKNLKTPSSDSGIVMPKFVANKAAVKQYLQCLDVIAADNVIE